MRHDLLDRYSRLRSPIHRLPAAVKLLAAIGIACAAALLRQPGWIVLSAIAMTLLIVAAASRVPWIFLLKRMLLLEPFVIGVALMALFQPNGSQRFIFLVARCSVCLLAMILLSSTTTFSALLRVLRKAQVPALLITTLALMYRYLFVLADESQRMKRARLSRTLVPNRARTWRTTATVAGQLFVRASERAERVHAAMCARGWQ